MGVDGSGNLHTLILDAGAITYARTDASGAWLLEPAAFGSVASRVLSFDIDPSGVVHAFGWNSETAPVGNEYRHLYRCPASNAGTLPVTPAPTDGAWRERLSDVRPPPSWGGQGLVFDSTQHEIVLLGSPSGGSPPNPAAFTEVWSYPTNGTGWVRRTVTSTTNPGWRSNGQGVVYDPVRSRAVLIGGATSSDVWEFDSATAAWTVRPAVGTPPALAMRVTRLAYDVARAKIVVLVTGVCPAQCWELWDWEPTTGTFVARPSVDPKPIALTGIAYDVSSASIIAHGAGATWEWNTTTGAWTDRTGTAPAPAAGELVAGPGGRFVIYDGSATWEWSRTGSIWRKRGLTQLGPLDRVGALVAYHSENQTVWMFGGRGEWRYITPGGQASNGLVFDITFEWHGPSQAP